MQVVDGVDQLTQRVSDLERMLKNSEQRERDARNLAQSRLEYMNFLSRKVEALRVRVADLATKGAGDDLLG